MNAADLQIPTGGIAILSRALGLVPTFHVCRAYVCLEDRFAEAMDVSLQLRPKTLGLPIGDIFIARRFARTSVEGVARFGVYARRCKSFWSLRGRWNACVGRWILNDDIISWSTSRAPLAKISVFEETRDFARDEENPSQCTRDQRIEFECADGSGLAVEISDSQEQIFQITSNKVRPDHRPESDLRARVRLA